MYNRRVNKEPIITIDKADHKIMALALRSVLADTIFIDADKPDKEHLVITSCFDEIRYDIAKRAIIKLFTLFKENRKEIQN